MKPDIRQMPIDEVRVVKAYRDLVPKPLAQDLELLRVEVRANGLDPAHPLVVNEDLVVLDGHTRLEIAKDLGLEWVWVTVKDLEDNWAEREFVIKANLARRQLNTAQRAELGLKLLEIERERAKRRQQLAGQLYGRGQSSPSPEEFLRQWVQGLQEQAVQEAVCRTPVAATQATQTVGDEKVVPNSEQPITCSHEQVGSSLDTLAQQEGKQDEKVSATWRTPITCPQSQAGKATAAVAQQVGVSSRTLERAQAIQQAAQQDPQVASDWEDAKAGKTSVHRVYRKVRVKDLPQHYGAGIKPGPFSLKVEPPPEPKPERIYTEEEKWELLWMVSDHYGVRRESLRHVITTDKTAWFYWHQIVHDYMIPDIGWMFIMDRVKRYEQEQLAKLASERPLPEGAESLGPWALDHAHVVGVKGLLSEFPAEAAHLVYTNAVDSGPEELEELAAFGQRALVPGKWLAAYVSQAMLPAALGAMAACGLELQWVCSVTLSKDQRYFDLSPAQQQRLAQWRMLLLFRKPGPETRQFEVLRDAGDAEEVLRQVLEAFTLPGQVVVDPWVRDRGMLGVAAKALSRRFLLFHGDREQALKAEFNIAGGACAGRMQH